MNMPFTHMLYLVLDAMGVIEGVGYLTTTSAQIL
jgi:hypothetical protein